MSDDLDRLSEIVAREKEEHALWVSICPSAWEESQDAQIAFTKQRVVFRANRKARLMLGYSQRQIRGKAVEELMPERFRTAHRRHTEGYIQDPVPRFMGVGAGLDLWLLTADGIEVQVEISLSPLESDERGLFINTVIRKKRDVTV